MSVTPLFFSQFAWSLVGKRCLNRKITKCKNYHQMSSNVRTVKIVKIARLASHDIRDCGITHSVPHSQDMFCAKFEGIQCIINRKSCQCDTCSTLYPATDDIYIYIYIYMCVYVCICMCICFCSFFISRVYCQIS